MKYGDVHDEYIVQNMEIVEDLEMRRFEEVEDGLGRYHEKK